MIPDPSTFFSFAVEMPIPSQVYSPKEKRKINK